MLRIMRLASRIIAVLLALVLPFQFYMVAHTQGVSCVSTICSGGSGGIAAGGDTTFTGNNTFSGSNVASGLWTFGTAAGAVDSITYNSVAGTIEWEGAAADAAEARLTHQVNAGFDTTTTMPALQTAQTVMYTNANQTVTGGIIFNQGPTVAAAADNALVIGAITTLGGIYHDTTQTPDTLLMVTGTTSNAWNLAEQADEDFDFNNGSCGTAPCVPGTQINIHGGAQNTTEYHSIAYWGSAGRAIKALTAASATPVFRVSVASGAGTGGEVQYTVFASDGTDHQARSGALRFQVINKANTETCVVVAAPTEAADGSTLAASSGVALAYTWACDTSPTDAVDLTLDAASDLTETSLDIYYRVNLYGPGQVTPQ